MNLLILLKAMLQNYGNMLKVWRLLYILRRSVKKNDKIESISDLIFDFVKGFDQKDLAIDMINKAQGRLKNFTVSYDVDKKMLEVHVNGAKLIKLKKSL